MMSAEHSESSQVLRRIARVSLIARIMLIGGAALTLVSWIAPYFAGQPLQFSVGPINVSWTLWSDWSRVYADFQAHGWPAFEILVAPRLVVFIAMIWQLARLLRLYETGRVFTDANIRCLRTIGVLSIVWALVLLAYPALVVAAATAFGAPYQGSRFSVGWAPLYFFVIGMLGMVMAWVMREALRLRIDHDETI